MTTDDTITVACHGLTDDTLGAQQCCERTRTVEPEYAPLYWFCNDHRDQYDPTLNDPGPCPTYGCGFQRTIETETGFFCLVCCHHHIRADWRPFRDPFMDDNPREFLYHEVAPDQ